MDISEQYAGSNVAFSPSGDLLACISNGRLRIQYTHTPERATEIKIRPLPKDISSIRWSPDGTFISIFSPSLIEVLDLENDTHRIRLDNGSAGLGRFASADFIGPSHLLVTWEFGRAKLWNLHTGKGTDLGDLKTRCESPAWALRPSPNPATQTLALLSRLHAQDHLALHFPATNHTTSPSPLPTTDARGLLWSPDGHWLAIPDTAHARPSLHIYTPDGHAFRSYPPSLTPETPSNSDIATDTDLGLKSLTWSPTSHLLSLARHTATLTLLNTRTFSPLAEILHSTSIACSPPNPVTIHQQREDKSYTTPSPTPSQPLSLPLSPTDQGISDHRFSPRGRYLATRDARAPSTVWLWDTLTLQPRAVIIQQNNIRRMQWSSTTDPDEEQDTLLLDSGESVAYLFAPASRSPPKIVTGFDDMPATPSFSFAPASSSPALLASTKTAYRLLYPYGRPSPASPPQASNPPTQRPRQPPPQQKSDFEEEEEEEEDSLLLLLTGRKATTAASPHFPSEPGELSYTQQIDWEAEAETQAGGLDDTFRAKRRNGNGREGRGEMRVEERVEDKDPLDDSEIF